MKISDNKSNSSSYATYEIVGKTQEQPNTQNYEHRT